SRLCSRQHHRRGIRCEEQGQELGSGPAHQASRSRDGRPSEEVLVGSPRCTRRSATTRRVDLGGMSAFALPFSAPLADYEREARELYEALKSGDMRARWTFKWMHPRYRRKTVSEVEPQALDLADAQIVVAQEYAFWKWEDLAKFTEAVARAGPIARFEIAVDSVVDGDLAALESMLGEHPELAHARSTRRHHATL